MDLETVKDMEDAVTSLVASHTTDRDEPKMKAAYALQSIAHSLIALTRMYAAPIGGK